MEPKIARAFNGKEEVYKVLKETLQGRSIIHTYAQFIDKSNIPIRGLGAIPLRPETTDFEAFTICKDYQSNVLERVQEGQGLYIQGSVGNGKSSWAYKIAQQYAWERAQQGNITEFPVYFISVPELLVKLKEGFEDYQLKKELDYSLNNADLVIFDDIGAENSTNYSREQLFYFINGRYAQGKATIFTSNASLDKLEMRIGDRIKEMTQVVTFTGQSSR